MTDPQDGLYQAAGKYLSRGWNPIPIGRSKRPLVRWKRLQTERVTMAELRTWFARGGVTGVGLICGEISGGLCVRDFDDPAEYERWSQAYPDVATALPTVVSGRAGGGWHVYCRAPDRFWRTRKIPGTKDHWKANGSYVVAPPSRHPSGAVYQWLGDLPAALPYVADPWRPGRPVARRLTVLQHLRERAPMQPVRPARRPLAQPFHQNPASNLAPLFHVRVHPCGPRRVAAST